jgi:hypothetical protein
VSGELQAQAALPPGERAPGILWIGLDDVEKRKLLTLPGLELGRLGGPARSQSLYRLRYPGYPYIYDVRIWLAESSRFLHKWHSYK